MKTRPLDCAKLVDAMEVVDTCKTLAFEAIASYAQVSDCEGSA
jgi:hypothetical protein